MKNFVLYSLSKPGEEARYIGITSQPLKNRLHNHLFRKDGSHHKTAWIEKMKREGFKPLIIPLCVGLSKEEACELEINTISTLRKLGIDLVNLTDGGDCGPGGLHTDVTKKRLSALNSGKRHTPESRRKISEALKGRVFSEELRKKISEARKGKGLGPLSLETRKKLSKVLTGRKMSSATIEKMRASKKLRDEERRQESMLAEMWGSRG